MAFQYTPYQPVDMSNVLEPFLRARQAKKDQEEKRAELLLRQQAADRDQARIDEQIRHTRELETRQQGLDVADAIPKIKSMLTPGSPDYDPESAMSMARARGINLSAAAPQMPQAPTAPVDKPLSSLGGRSAQPDDLMVPGQEGGLDAISGGPAPPEVAQNTAAANKYAADVQDYKSKLAEASRRSPTYTGTSPIGPISIDPNSAVASREEKLRQQRERLSPLTASVDEQFRPVIVGMIQAGMPESEVAKAIAERQKEMHQDQEKKNFNLTAEDQRRHQREMERIGWATAGSRERAVGANEANRNDATMNRNLTTYLGQVKEFENTAGVNKDVAMMKNIGKIHEELTSNPQSPIAQAAAIDTIAQIAQGGKASQGVMAQINAHALGPIESAADKVYQATHNGSHSPAWIKSMSDTLSGLKRFASDEQSRVMKGFEAAAGDESPFGTPEYSALRDAQRRKLAAALGMDIPAQRQPEQGAMRPGSGKRPEKAPSNPIIDARHRPSLDDLAAEHGL